MRFYSYIIAILVLFCICVFIPCIAFADSNQSSISPGSQTEIYSGSIPSGDGVVSIKSVSGKLYQVPAMSPLGVIQALAGTDTIDNYKIGDELITKRGILTLDGINDYVNSGEDSWFVLVNEKQLQDYLLPTEEGLNAYPLKTGDKIIFAYGNPTKSSREATASIRITIGAQSDSAISVTVTPTTTPTVELSPTNTFTPTPTTLTPTPEQTTSSVESGKDLNQPVYEDNEEKTSVTTESPSSSRTKDLNQPVYGDSEKSSEVTTESTPSSTKDPNQPVYGDSEESSGVTTESTPSSTKDPNQPVYGDGEESSGVTTESTPSSTKDPNQPVYEGSDENSAITSESTSSSKIKDSNQPVYGDSEESSEENSDSVDTEETEETSTEEPTPSAAISKSGQHVLYDGSINLPSGDVNVTATSEMDYDIGADTPLGLLQYLVNDGKISVLSINDRGMRKGNILAIDGIEDYQYGDEAWFVQVNDLTLQSYTNPDSDGLNVRKINSGDEVTYFYGKQDQTPDTAKAAIYLTIE